MSRNVRFSRRAESDLTAIYDFIAEKSDTETAFAYTLRIRDYCLSLETFPERGTPWGNLLSGMRVVGFERRVAIAFRVTPESVIISRILYGGRDIQRALRLVRI